MGEFEIGTNSIKVTFSIIIFIIVSAFIQNICST